MDNLVAFQMVSSPDIEANLNVVEQMLKQQSSGSLVVLPECFACFGGGDAMLVEVSEGKGSGKVQQRLSELAKQYGVWLVAGTFPLKSSNPGKFTASTLVFDDQGECVAEYQKIHLFDVQVEDNTGQYLESRYTDPGQQLVVLDSPFGRLGIAVCYDVRFPAMFNAMGQIDVLALPSAFTRRTGEAHWYTLLGARAIEKQCYVIGANQGGVHANGRETFGHSCIISPWGERLTEISSGQGAINARMSRQQLLKIRESMPVTQHNKFRSDFV